MPYANNSKKWGVRKGSKMFLIALLSSMSVDKIDCQGYGCQHTHTRQLIQMKMGFHRLIVTLHCQGEQHRAVVMEAVEESGIE